MSSYYAKIAGMGGGNERLVAITGRLQGNLLRVIDVNINGKPMGNASYLPANIQIVEMKLGSDGYLTEAGTNEPETIDWQAHESKVGYVSEDETEGETESTVSDAPSNPAMAAFPELQE